MENSNQPAVKLSILIKIVLTIISPIMHGFTYGHGTYSETLKEIWRS